MARKKRQLSDDDRQLWHRLTERVDPLHPEKKSPPPAIFPPKKASPRREPAAPIKPFRIGDKAQTAPPDRKPAINETAAKVSPNMDKRNFQRLLKGRLEIDATLGWCW